MCTATKQTPYQLVFGQAPRSMLALVEILFSLGIHDEEELPDGMIVDDSLDQSIEGNGERTVYTDENMTTEVEQSTGERDVSSKQ